MKRGENFVEKSLISRIFVEKSFVEFFLEFCWKDVFVENSWKSWDLCWKVVKKLKILLKRGEKVEIELKKFNC